MAQSRYLSTGFIPLNEPPRTCTLPVANVTVVRGDILQMIAAGVNTYATNGTAAMAATFLGVAASPVVGNAAFSTSVEFYPFLDNNKYIVPVQNALITRAAIGTRVQTSAVNNIILTTTVATGICFYIEDIDVTAAALVGNAFGYALGRFRSTGVQA